MSKRRRLERETPEFADMLARMIRSYARRVGEADEVDLARMIELGREFDAAVTMAVVAQHARGVSWAGIAAATGATRQAAFQRWGAAAREHEAQLQAPAGRGSAAGGSTGAEGTDAPGE